MRHFRLLLCVAFSLLAAGQAGERTAPPVRELPLVRTDTPPLIDGRGLDAAWMAAKEITWQTSGGIFRVKACTDGEKLYLLIRMPAETEMRNHRLWHWDPLTQYYISGSEEEAALTVLVRAEKQPYPAGDIWIWRAARTDPTGYADDGMFSAPLPNGNGFDGRYFRPDAGTPCWQSRYPAKFAGEIIPRFYPVPPSGSRADVRAKGTWDAGYWTIELSRALRTGNTDDLEIHPGKNQEIILFPGLPTPETVGYPLRLIFPAEITQ